MSHVTDALEAGREATRRYAWREGYELLVDADAAAALSPEDLEELAAAAWWTGRLESCISARERAFLAYMAAENRRRAAVVAMALAKDYYAKRCSSIGTAWVSRAERLLADEPDCAEQGHLERLQSVIAFEGVGDFDKALAHGRRAAEIGTRFGDRELQALAVHDQGRVLVAKGQVAEGMALIDEATVAAVSGELSPYNTGVIYCNTITACKELADYRRAGDWTDAAKRWCERQAIAGFPGMCRVYRASIMLVRGAWPEAELEARRACDELMEFNLSYAAEAFYELGEIRMRMGDLVAAEEAFNHAHELGRDPQPALALLRLAEGKTEAALAGIDQALDEESRELHRAGSCPPRSRSPSRSLIQRRRARLWRSSVPSPGRTEAMRSSQPHARRGAGSPSPKGMCMPPFGTPARPSACGRKSAPLSRPPTHACFSPRGTWPKGMPTVRCSSCRRLPPPSTG